jgi:hypothetical protein
LPVLTVALLDKQSENKISSELESENKNPKNEISSQIKDLEEDLKNPKINSVNIDRISEYRSEKSKLKEMKQKDKSKLPTSTFTVDSDHLNEFIDGLVEEMDFKTWKSKKSPACDSEEEIKIPKILSDLCNDVVDSVFLTDMMDPSKFLDFDEFKKQHIEKIDDESSDQKMESSNHLDFDEFKKERVEIIDDEISDQKKNSSNLSDFDEFKKEKKDEKIDDENSDQIMEVMNLYRKKNEKMKRKQNDKKKNKTK